MENVYVAMQTLKWITLPSLSWSPLNKNIEDNTYTCICYILNRLFVVLMMSIDKQKAVPLSLLTPPYQTRSVGWEGFIRGIHTPLKVEPLYMLSIHADYMYWYMYMYLFRDLCFMHIYGFAWCVSCGQLLQYQRYVIGKKTFECIFMYFWYYYVTVI